MGDERELDGRNVPPTLFKALSAPLLGQKLGVEALKVMDFIDEEAVLDVPEVFTRTTPSKLSVKSN